MAKTPERLFLLLLVLLGLAGPADALYKRWIPDTNYENQTNWDQGSVPCGNDKVWFSAGRKVSVFVETTHAVQEMRLPLDGEFLLNSGAGFYVVAGQDPACGPGVTTKFKDSDSLQWFDPALWQAAETPDDLQREDFLFSVHEESVPCADDDVLFDAGTSFRVDTSSSLSAVAVRSVSVQGRKFDAPTEFAQYLVSGSGRLQFHGSSAVTVGGPGCADPSGCECGNAANRQRICAAVKCSALSCKTPLSPVGHCCEVCGAIVTVRYATGFDLRVYRQRLRHLFLLQPQYKSIQLGASKISNSLRFLGLVPWGTTSLIQVLILDGDQGLWAESLAREIVNDAHAHGSSLGITEAEFQASSGNSSGQSGSSTGVVIGAVLGVLVLIALVVVLVTLVRRGVVRAPTMTMQFSLGGLKRRFGVGAVGGPNDHGFANPMFDNVNMPDIHGVNGTDAGNSVSFTQTGNVYYINPVYDQSETDFSA